MKIVLINSLYKPYFFGGAEAVVAEAARIFSEQGHDAVIITSKPAFSGVHQDFVQKIRVVRFFPLSFFWVGNLSRHNAFFRFVWHVCDTLNLVSAFHLARLIRREKPDRVFTHNLKGIGFLTLFALRLMRYRVVHTVHDVQLFTPSGLILFGAEDHWIHRNILTRWYAFLCRFLFSFADVVVFPSQFLHDFYTSRNFFSRSQKKVIRNPYRAFPKISPVSVLNIKEKSDPTKKLELLFLGQVEPHKGIEFLVSALRVYDREFHLTVAGGGSLLETLSEQVAGDERFSFLGSVPHEKIQDLFSSVHVLVLPTLCYENTPAVILESLGFGVPVIASRIGGIPELVSDGKNAILFEPKNQEQLLAALREITDHYEDFSLHAKNGTKTFSESEYVEAMLKF